MSIQSVALGEVATFLNGGTPSRARPDFFEGNIPWITGADITASTVDKARSHISDQAIKGSATNLVPAGTVLLVTRTSVGKVAVTGMPLAFSQDITAVVHDAGKLDAQYLVHFLRTQQPLFERAARGATIKGVTRSMVESLRLPLPSLKEQRRIAAMLDTADRLRSKRRAAITVLDQLPHAIFLEMFRAATGNWSTTTVQAVAGLQRGSIRTGPFGSQLLHGEFVDAGIAVLGIDNAVSNEFRWGQRRYISNSKYASLKRYTVHPGDVLITIMGTCGRCAVVPRDIPVAINTKHLCCITLDQSKCLPEYLHAFFLYHPESKKYLSQTTKGAIMGGLNMEIIRRLPLKLPPLTIQEEYVRRLGKIAQARAWVSSGETLADELFNSIQSRAFVQS